MNCLRVSFTHSPVRFFALFLLNFTELFIWHHFTCNIDCKYVPPPPQCVICLLTLCCVLRVFVLWGRRKARGKRQQYFPSCVLRILGHFSPLTGQKTSRIRCVNAQEFMRQGAMEISYHECGDGYHTSCPQELGEPTVGGEAALRERPGVRPSQAGFVQTL